MCEARLPLARAGRVGLVALAIKALKATLYCHHDLRAQVLGRGAQAQPDASLPLTTQVSRQSPLTDLANPRAHNERRHRQVNWLARRLSDALGGEVFRASGLGGSDDTEQLHRRVTGLEQRSWTPRSVWMRPTTLRSMAEKVTVRVRDGTVDITPVSAGEHAAVRILTDRRGFIELVRGHASERVRIEGDADALARMLRVFSLEETMDS
jgi:hypothetical protein